MTQKEITKEMLDNLDEENFSSVWWDYCQEIGELPDRVYSFNYSQLVNLVGLQAAKDNCTCDLLNDLFSSLGTNSDGDLLKAIIEGNVKAEHKYIIAHNKKLYTSDSARELAKMSQFYDEDMMLEHFNENIDDFKETFNILTRYCVEVQVTKTYYLEIEALDEDDAEEKANDEIDSCYNLDDRYESYNDEYSIVDVTEDD